MTWLRVQFVTLRLRPLELNLASDFDLACVELVNKAEFLQDFMRIKEGTIMFNENVAVGQAVRMMVYAKENYNPPLRT